MLIAPGTRLGPYEILAPLGAGGMGEVYRARDTRLDRVVAIKVLPAMLATDREFRARFEREAKSISALNHPHICTLHDVGRQDDVEYLVMEHLDGESLAARLLRGPIPANEALAYAVQIADALDKAHRHGIVHRDLKPANIFLLKTGTASGPGICKLLDFGLAKIGPLTSSGIVETKLATSPPGDAPLTARGSILGTFQYMAPEQIEGQEADARTDIWAFGCVLYEMITGRRAFEGRSQASLIASILERQPAPIAELQPMTPPALGRIVRTCLEKNPDNRFHTAHDLCLQLQWIEEGGSAAGLPAPVIAGRKRNERAIFAALLLGAVALAAAGVWSLRPEAAPDNVVSRFSMTLPEGQRFSRSGRRNIAISPDGTQFAYIANEQIYLRRMDELEAQPIRGTAIDPLGLVFSPDGQWIAFFTPPTLRAPLAGNTILRKIAVTGGVPVTLASGLEPPFGTRWQAGRIVFSTGTAILSVPDTAGTPTRHLVLDEKADEQFAQPQLVNRGRDVLYSVRKRAGAWNDGQIAVQPISGGERRIIVHGGTDGRLAPSGDRLFFIRDATLFMQDVDPKTLEPAGGPVPVMEGVRQLNVSGSAQWDVSENGTLVFVSGSGQTNSALAWVDRHGKEEIISTPPHQYLYPRLSPDGTKIAVDAADEEADVWVWDLARKTLAKLTSGADPDMFPVWTPDSRSVIYRSSNRGGQGDLFRRAVDGTGSVGQLTKTEQGETPLALVRPAGMDLLIRVGGGGDPFLALASLTGNTALKRLLPPPSTQHVGEISPDGRWLAYQSRESSTDDEIYVRPYPDVERQRWQISITGGQMPVWSRSGRELFFQTARLARLNAVAISPSPGSGTFSYGAPVPLFDAAPYSLSPFGRSFDVSLDGKRFLMLKPEGRDSVPQIVVISHWLDELARRSPAGAR